MRNLCEDVAGLHLERILAGWLLLIAGCQVHAIQCTFACRDLTGSRGRA
jgi:hypothetical protein